MAGLIKFFGGRAMAWLVLGGGALFVVTGLWQSAKQRGASIEAGIWRQMIGDKQKKDRDANFTVNGGTISEQGSLQEQEAQIRAKWATMGRKKEGN